MYASANQTFPASAGQAVREQFPDSAMAILAKLLDDARAAFAHDVGAARGYVETAVDLIVRSFPAAVRSAPGPRSGLAVWQTNKVARFVEANIEQTIRVDDLAALARLSRSYFSKAFRRSFGMSPHDYVMERRVEQAKNLMLKTDEPLCQIAAACGLTDQAHLSRLFKRATGYSPNMWRRRGRAERTIILLGAGK